MKFRIDNRLIAAFTASTVLLLPGCERVLDVVDQIEPPGSNPPGGPNPTSPTPCDCASSASLLPLSCGLSEVALLDNDVVQSTADGSVVAFSVCDPNTFICQVVHWEGSSTIISSGLMLGLSASGQQVLSTGDGTPGGVELTDMDGPTSNFPLNMLVGRGSLSAAGDVIVGSDIDGSAVYLARADVATGDIERLGEVGGGVARTYVTPDASHIVGFTLDIFDPSLSEVFRWNEQDGLTFGLPGVAGDSYVWPEAMSADGSVLAGRANNSHFRYTEATGITEIATTSSRSETFISKDGNVVVGSLAPAGGDSAAFRWTQASGAVDLTPGITSLAIGTSDDGGVVVASSWEDAQFDGADPEHTFVWDAEHGTRSLDAILAARGIDTAGWDFGHARAISGNGKVLLGRAHCGGEPTLYRVVLSD